MARRPSGEVIMNRSGKYELMEREFVTGEVTYAQLGEKYGRSPGSIGRIAKIDGWMDKRRAYRVKVANAIDDQASDEYSGRVLKLQGKFLDALDETLTKYHAGVRDGSIVPNPSDVGKLMTIAREIVAKPAAPESSEGTGVGIRISETLGRELFGTLESVARGRLESGAMAGAPRPKLIGTSQG